MYMFLNFTFRILPFIMQYFLALIFDMNTFIRQQNNKQKHYNTIIKYYLTK